MAEFSAFGGWRSTARSTANGQKYDRWKPAVDRLVDRKKTESKALWPGRPAQVPGVGCLTIIKDKSSKAESQTPDAGLIPASTAAPRRVSRNPRPSQHCSAKARGSKTRVSVSTVAPRRVGRNPRLSQHCSTKARGSKPVSQLALQHQGAWVETRVSVITFLVMGSITTHIMRKLTPIVEYF